MSMRFGVRSATEVNCSHRSRPTLYWLLTLAVLTILSVGCNREKAEAVKTASGQFHLEASAALREIEQLLLDDVAMPATSEQEQLDKLVQTLEATDYSSASLAAILSDSGVLAPEQSTAGANAKVRTAVADIERHYAEFESMFERLPEGHWFAGAAVARAETLAIKLSLQVVALARQVEKHPFKDNARRLLLFEHVAAARASAESSSRKAALASVAREALEVHRAEGARKAAVIERCLRAATSGRNLAELLRDYRRMSLGEVLSSGRQALAEIGSISDGSLKTDTLIKRLDGIEESIRRDPYWKSFIDQSVVH